MTVFFFAVLANEDGTPSDIDVGGGRDENTAAKAALRAANDYKQNTLVIGIDSVSGKKQVMQTIRYMEGGAIAPTPPTPPTELPTGFHRKHLRGASLPAVLDFVMAWVSEGYTVTVSPMNPTTLLCEAEASKKV
jgi:hypothetical protein